MNRFITRVELHGATLQDYEKLHRHMAEAKFGRTIESADGQTYALPTATYISSGNLSANDVRQLAIRAANQTGRAAWVLVTEAKEIAWSLAPVTRPSPVANLLAALRG